VDQINDLFDTLKATPFNATKSMLDVTTVVLTSEMNRTFRSQLTNTTTEEDTGTDHNPFSNVVLIGGKNIKPGLIIGESDLNIPIQKPITPEFELDVSDADRERGWFWSFADLSPAHVQKEGVEPLITSPMGKPFDFSRMEPSATPLSEISEFVLSDYLTYSSVINTVYKAFGVPADKYLRITSTSLTAPTLDILLNEEEPE
jgi:hypothetical protein